MQKKLIALATFTALHTSNIALAHNVAPDDHAPIGVMADHAHKKGGLMVSVRHMHMEMEGNQIGSDSVSPETIATTVPNIFLDAIAQPPTLRIVPTSMRTDMTMVGAMYAPTDWVTLVAMGSYIEKEMEHTTFAGGAGTTVAGEFTTNPKGFGDVTIGGIFPVLGVADRQKGDSQIELNIRAAISAPVGSTDETAQILVPTGATPTVRIPYPMQLGSGTWDLKPAVTLKGWSGKLGYGAQYAGVIRTGTNKQGYRLGDMHEATAWLSYRAAKWVSLSGRMKARTTGRINGIDSNIVGPVQTANPNFHGGERLDLIVGANFVATHGPLAKHRLGFEIGKPVYQDLNGPQMASDWMFTLGWQKAF